MENSYCIYRITNPKGFIYIGQSKHIKKRLTDYRYPNSIKLQVFIHNSIVKYGLKNHIIEILHEGLTSEEANAIEIAEIAKYKSLKISLNISDGGQLVSKTRHVAVVQCDLEGNFIKRFDSYVEASLITGIPKTSISNTVKNNKGYSKGFLWCTEKDWNNGIKPIWKAKVEGNMSVKREVYQFDLLGNFVSKFSHPEEARKVLKLNPRSLNNLATIPFSKTGGWLFSYNSGVLPYKNHRLKEIIQLDNLGNVINEFKSGIEAMKILKMSESVFYKILKEKKSEKFKSIILIHKTKWLQQQKKK